MARKRNTPRQGKLITSGGFSTPDTHKIDILLQSPELFHLDIAAYMRAVSSATAIDMYNRAALYDMYSSAFLTDPHLVGIHRKRLVGACRTPIKFLRNGKPVDSVNAELEQPWFRRFRKDVVDSELWGFTLMQFFRDSDNTISYDRINRKHYDPVKEVILRYQLDNDGAPVEAFSNTILVGDDPRSVGLMAAIMPYVLYKRNNIGDWAQFAQIFGMPIREYTYEAGDEDARKRLLADAKRQGANAVYIHPADSDLKLIESGNKTGSSDLYKDFTAECDSQMSIAMLGNTLTTDAKATGTQALGSVHQEEENEIKEDDEALILATLNDPKMLRILASLGLDVEGGRFEFVRAKTVEKSVQLSAVTQLAEKMGLPIDDDYLYETFDIEKPETYDKLKAEALRKAEERQARQEELMRQLQGENTPAPEPKSQSEFWNRVKGFFSHAPQDGADFPF